MPTSAASCFRSLPGRPNGLCWGWRTWNISPAFGGNCTTSNGFQNNQCQEIRRAVRHARAAAGLSMVPHGECLSEECIQTSDR